MLDVKEKMIDVRRKSQYLNRQIPCWSYVQAHTKFGPKKKRLKHI